MIDYSLVPHEEFLGMHLLPNTKSDEIVIIIKDILLRMNLKLTDARGQCYSAASMAGEKSGVVTQIKSLNGICLYSHCYGHALNLAIGDVIKSISSLRVTFDTVHEICKLVKNIPTHRHKIR